MSDSLIDDLQVRLSELQRLVEAQALEIAGLRADVRRSEPGNTAIAARNPTSDIAGKVGPSEPSQKLSRRAFARLGAMAGVGAAAAATVAVLGADASPAGAVVGRDVLLGKDNIGGRLGGPASSQPAGAPTPRLPTRASAPATGASQPAWSAMAPSGFSAPESARTVPRFTRRTAPSMRQRQKVRENAAV